MTRLDQRLVVFDLETGGLDQHRNPITQIAAVAVDAGGREWSEIEAFEVKVRFVEANADPEALALNSYDPAVWQLQAVPEREAAERFSTFLRRHAGLAKVSKAGRPYTIARLCAYNGSRFDGEWLATWYKRMGLFCPAACFEILDPLPLARWMALGAADAPGDLKLASVCRWLGVPLVDAHDALADVRATAAVSRALVARLVAGSQQAAGAAL